jgi:NhaP-type Na+/H+ or K+/H+ antiporter
VHASGVLAVVAMGLFVGRRGRHLLASETRLQAHEMWEVLTFLVNGILFILVGLEMPAILDTVSSGIGELVRDATLVCATVVALRILWVFPAAWIPRALSARLRRRDPMPSWQELAILSWAGLRGAVSLAAALALPVTLESGAPIRERGVVIFVTFAVIIATLVGQGVTLPWLITVLGVGGDTEARREESRARLLIARAALERLSSLGDADGIPGHLVEDLRHHLHHQVELYGDAPPRRPSAVDADAFERAWRLVLEAERRELVRLRDRDVIDDDVMRRIERDLDLRQAAL